jgi:hypothetical protein
VAPPVIRESDYGVKHYGYLEAHAHRVFQTTNIRFHGWVIKAITARRSNAGKGPKKGVKLQLGYTSPNIARACFEVQVCMKYANANLDFDKKR